MKTYQISKISALVLCGLFLGQALAQDTYYPPRGDWEYRPAEAVGMDFELLDDAVELALANTVVEPNDLREHINKQFGREPHFSIIGPTKERIMGSGVVIKDGYMVARWGDVEREDMTFSVTKSYLSTMVGLAWDDGLIDDMDDRVSEYMDHPSFDDPHNAPITWAHLLQQNSDWSGTLWGKPDWADRPHDFDPAVAIEREMHEPGTFFKYNDTRVNLTALAATHVWKRPLPQVLKERIMDPIDASDEWEWHGYENSYITIDGQNMQVPSGGAHWGGGFFISTMDHARLGYLFLRNGNWNGKQLISEEWIDMVRVPSEPFDRYGYMWWLNTNQAVASNAPASAFYASGSGGNYIWVDQENDLLVVMRWVPRMGEVIEAFTAAIN